MADRAVMITESCGYTWVSGGYTHECFLTLNHRTPHLCIQCGEENGNENTERS